MYSAFSNDGNLKEGSDPSNLNKPASLVKSMYCNGSRWPVEAGGTGWLVPPGTNESNALPAPPFTLQPGAVVDEGNNWINLQWGPLVMTSPATGQVFNNPLLNSSSTANDDVPSTSPTFALAPATDFYGNPRPDPANPTKLDIGAVQHQPPPPTLTSISPNSGNRGYSYSVTFTGSGFASGGAVTLNTPAGITASNLVVGGDTSVTATLTIAKTATLGANQIGVNVGSLHSGTLPFTVSNPPAPTITSITPSSGLRGMAVTVTITGTSLSTTSAIGTGANSGIVVSQITAVNDSTVTARFTIVATATNGPRTVTVQTLSGNATTTFNVIAPLPATITSITPASGTRGTLVPVTLIGTNFTVGSTLSITSGSNIVGSGMVESSDGTQITVNFNILANAPIRANNVTVTNSTGTASNAVAFSVTAGTPNFSVSAMTSNPSNLAVKTGTVTLSNSASGATAGPLTLTAVPTIAPTAGGGTWSVTGGSCTSGLVLNPGNTCTINVQYTYPTGSAAGSATARVTISDTGSSTGTTTQTSPNISAAGPVLASVSPNSGYRGQTVSVSLAGYGFTGATGIGTGTNSGITVNSFTVVNDNTITANLVIASSASAGNRNITVNGGSSTPVTFTVNTPPPATITSITPASGVRGATVPVTLIGTNFFAGSTLTPAGGSGISVGSLVLSPDGTKMTANFTIMNYAGAPLGPLNVVVTNASGTASAPVTFTVTAGTASFTVPTNMTTTPADTTTKTGTVTVTNSASGSTAGPLTLTANPTIARTAGTGTFSIISGGTCVSGLVLNPGDTCSVNVQYVPGGSSPTGTATGRITVTDSGSSTGMTTQGSPFFNAN
jgi:hypothetical protein